MQEGETEERTMSIVTEINADSEHGYAFGVDGLLSVSEAAEALKVSTRTVFSLLQSGHLRRGKIVRRTVVCRRSLQKYIQSLEA